ncbi:flagellar biosynthesis protein FlhA [compost metagenome]
MFLNWDASLEADIMQKIAREIRKARVSGVNPVILTRRKDVRIGLVKVLNKFNIEIPVLCLDELDSDADVEQIAIVG